MSRVTNDLSELCCIIQKENAAVPWPVLTEPAETGHICVLGRGELSDLELLGFVAETRLRAWPWFFSEEVLRGLKNAFS